MPKARLETPLPVSIQSKLNTDLRTWAAEEIACRDRYHHRLFIESSRALSVLDACLLETAARTLADPTVPAFSDILNKRISWLYLCCSLRAQSSIFNGGCYMLATCLTQAHLLRGMAQVGGAELRSYARQTSGLQVSHYYCMLQRFSKATRASNGMLSRATVYANVNANRPSSYSDYENFSIQWG